MRHVLMTVLLFAGASPCPAESRVILSENFDAAVPEWLTGVKFSKNIEVNFVGVAPDRSASGGQSVKIDVNHLRGIGAAVWWRLPFRIPLTARPQISARVWTGESNTILGAQCEHPERDFEKELWRDFGRGRGQGTGGWETLYVDTWEKTFGAIFYRGKLPENGYVDGIGFYLDREWMREDGRILLYVDDVVVTADISADDLRSFGKFIDGKQEQMRERMRERLRRERARKVKRLHASLHPCLRSVAGRTRQLPGTGPLAELEARLLDHFAQIAPEAESQLKKATASSDDEQAVAWLDQNARELKLAADALVALSNYPRAWREMPYWIGVSDPTRKEAVLPDRFPPAARPAGEIRVTACRGEYEPASVVVETSVPLEGMMVTVSALKGGAANLPPSVVDVRWVKRWWQAGRDRLRVGEPQLVPELLLKDPDFVSVSPDRESHANRLKNPAAAADAETLQLVDVPAGSNQQMWLTVHVPPDAQPGTYRGEMTLSFRNAPSAVVPLALEVHPFTLLESQWDSSLYHRGRVTGNPLAERLLAGKHKTPEQLERELRNMREHGIRTPFCYQGFGRPKDGSAGFPRIQQYFEICKKAGILEGPVPVLASKWFTAYVNAESEEEKKAIADELLEDIEAYEKFRRQHGYPPLIYYAIDEAAGTTLMAEEGLMKALHEAGALVGAACSTEYFDAVGRYLHYPIVNKSVMVAEMRKSQALGHRIWVYARPQAGVEDPEINRRNYGLLLWKRGEDGACTYAYQSEFPEHTNIYDDFNDVKYRDHVMAYPTVNGVIDTVQWEGYREGVDDLRYLTTLLKTIEHARKKGREDLAREAESWLNAVDIDGDLSAVRQGMTKLIVGLQASVGPPLLP